MKALITAALALGFLIVSCKKNGETTTPTDASSPSTIDSTNMNSTPMASDNATTVSPSAGDTMNIQNQDSATAAPKQ
ncbi:MAG: hypothetical protein K0R36_2126 [Chryseobacterium sp.]|jgi:hypothetical protein|nr:hypothetical protein [Chryseobacterium sp.]